MNNLYEADFYTWANEQAALLRSGQIGVADVANIAEELESMVRAERNTLKSQLEKVLLHLLKWQYQPARRGRSWQGSIENAREALADVLAENPGLKPWVPQAVVSSYRRARRSAEGQTGLDLNTFPAACPWTFEQVCDPAFWPESD